MRTHSIHVMVCFNHQSHKWGVLAAFLALLLSGVQAAAIQARDDRPDWMTRSTAEINAEYKGLEQGAELKNPPSWMSYNNVMWWDNHFARMKTYIEKYPARHGDNYDESTMPAFMERHPYLNAAPLPTFDGESGRYIASASPLWRGGGMKTLWWDMIQQRTSDNAVIISLMERNEEPDPDWIRETTDTLIPPDKANPTVAYELEANGDETCNVKYTVSLVSSESPIKNVLEYRQLRLQYRGQSRNLHYIHYPAWANEQGIGNQNMKALIDLVNKKQVGTNPMVVSCMRGKGRTGTFIEARETWNLAMAAVKKHKNWLAEQKQSPFLTYTKVMRKIRSGMIDSSSQYRFLNSWGKFVWDEVQKILDKN